MSDLEPLVKAARDAGPDWEAPRANRVLAATLRLHEARLARARIARRTLAVVGGAAVALLLLVRWTPPSGAATTPETTEIASGDLGDGGYSRD